MSFKVVYFQRKPRRHGNFSIELLFEGIREAMPDTFQCSTSISRYESNGFWRRLYNIWEAALRQGDINHVTGDVHFLTLLLQRRKTILTVHDCGFMNHPSAIARAILKLFWLTLPVRQARYITVVSQETKNELLKYVSCDPDKIIVIPNFLSPAFQYKPKEFSAQRPVILHIGTAPNKNLERLAEALEGIKCQLNIVGNLSEQQHNILKKHQIDYHHSANLSQEEIVGQYQQCDILAFVSTYEGFGLPILEAQAIGRPVVTGNCSSMPEVAGNSACLVNPFDVSSIREGILRVIQDESYRKHLLSEGENNIKRFQLPVIAQKYVEVYERVRHS